MKHTGVSAGTKLAVLVAGVVALAMTACGREPATPATPGLFDRTAPTSTPDASVSSNVLARVLSVSVASLGVGCQSYADWWEVVSEEGELLIRRVLLHSHVDEQPFTRSGGPLNVQPGDTVIVSAHMSPGGYSGSAMRGTVAEGFFLHRFRRASPQTWKAKTPFPPVAHSNRSNLKIRIPAPGNHQD